MFFLLVWHFASFSKNLTSQPEQSPVLGKPLPPPILTQEALELFPFAIEQRQMSSDFYFGPSVPYDPNDKTVGKMRGIMIEFARAMDSQKHPCNPLNTSAAKIIGINIKPLSQGDKKYTLWFSDGKTICGMGAVHFEGASGVTFQGDYFQEFYIKEMAAGFGYDSRSEAEQVMVQDKKRFWKNDLGEVAHDMAVNAFGQDFLNETLPQQYSGFFVADAYNANYVENDRQHWFFTKNVVDASLRRTDMAGANPVDSFSQTKFQVHFQAEPSDSSLAFKVVRVSANNNGFDPSKMGGASGKQTAVRLE